MPAVTPVPLTIIPGVIVVVTAVRVSEVTLVTAAAVSVPLAVVVLFV